MIEPPIPIPAVSQSGIGSGPGTASRASAPMRRPPTIRIRRKVSVGEAYAVTVERTMAAMPPSLRLMKFFSPPLKN
jgi:hypothetical protein